jgi:DDE superfamily endonuclease
VPAGRFSVNMVSTVTNQGKVRWMIYTGRMNAALFLVFLTRLLAGSTKKVFLIVDHLSVHEAAAVKEWVAGKRDRIEVFCLPKYTPERNPDEYLNCDVKGNINTDGLPKDRDELRSKLHRFMQRLNKLPGRIASYFEHRLLRYAAAPEPVLS